MWRRKLDREIVIVEHCGMGMVTFYVHGKPKNLESVSIKNWNEYYFELGADDVMEKTGGIF